MSAICMGVFVVALCADTTVGHPLSGTTSSSKTKTNYLSTKRL